MRKNFVYFGRALRAVLFIPISSQISKVDYWKEIDIINFFEKLNSRLIFCTHPFRNNHKCKTNDWLDIDPPFQFHDMTCNQWKYVGSFRRSFPFFQSKRRKNHAEERKKKVIIIISKPRRRLTRTHTHKKTHKHLLGMRVGSSLEEINTRKTYYTDRQGTPGEEEWG